MVPTAICDEKTNQSTTPTSVVVSNDTMRGDYHKDLLTSDDFLQLLIYELAPEAFKHPSSFKEQYEGRVAMRGVVKSLRRVCHAWLRQVDFFLERAEFTLGSTISPYPLMFQNSGQVVAREWKIYDENVNIEKAFAPRALALATIQGRARDFCRVLKIRKLASQRFEWLAAMEARKAAATAPSSSDAQAPFSMGAGGPMRQLEKKRGERKARLHHNMLRSERPTPCRAPPPAKERELVAMPVGTPSAPRLAPSPSPALALEPFLLV